MLALAAKHGLNVNEIARKTVDSIIAPLLSEKVADSPNAMFVSLIGEPVSEDDLNAIRALEFFAHDPSQGRDMLLYSNTLIRKFLLLGRIHCASQIIASFPSECITGMSKNVRDEMENAVLEHYGYLSIHDCLQIESQWTSLYSQNPQNKQ